MKNENKKLIEKIDISNKNLNVMKNTKVNVTNIQLVNDLDKLSNNHDKEIKEASLIKEEINKVYQDTEKLRKKTRIYEEGLELENINEDELEKLEKLLIKRLDNVKDAKIKKKFQLQLGLMEKELMKKLPYKKVKELLSFCNQ